MFIEPLLCARHRALGRHQVSRRVCLHGTFGPQKTFGIHMWLHRKDTLIFIKSLLCQCLFLFINLPFLYSRISKIILYIY